MQSSHLAQHLRDLGVGLNTIVPILSVKSAWVIVAMLAVMKTGSAFVLMDPSHPEDRLADIVEQVNARVVIRSPETIRLSLPHAKIFVNISAPSGWLTDKTSQTCAETDNHILPSMLAYIIFSKF